MSYDTLETSRTQRTLTGGAELLLALHLDGPLFIALCLVGGIHKLKKIRAVPKTAATMKENVQWAKQAIK